MSKIDLLAIALVVLATTPAAAQSNIELDHIWIVVSPNAPERAALEDAGFQISPDVSRHDGQGTASIAVELENGCLELIWPGSTVPVAPEQRALASRYHHPNGSRRITGVRLISPKAYQPIAALKYLETQHVLSIEQGDQWLVEVTFDRGERKESKDLRPSLPIVIRY